jgi:hypothetical protein
MQAFVEAIRSGGAAPLSFDEAVAATCATLAIARSLVSGKMESCASVLAS